LIRNFNLMNENEDQRMNMLMRLEKRNQNIYNEVLQHLQ